MATATKPDRDARSDGQFVKYDHYIEQQVGKARGQVKSVELFSEMLMLSVGLLVYLLTFVLVDHWYSRAGWVCSVDRWHCWDCWVALEPRFGFACCPS